MPDSTGPHARPSRHSPAFLSAWCHHRVQLTLRQDPSSENLGTTVWDASIVLAKYLEKVPPLRLGMPWEGPHPGWCSNRLESSGAALAWVWGRTLVGVGPSPPSQLCPP